MRKLKLNPVTRKRIKRFCTFRRSYWSFWILVSFYFVSLFSELICNDRPLYVRYEDRSYFPFLKYYPDTLFTDSGLNTRPNYKAIARISKFADNPNNYMVFTPIPFGPYETLNASDVKTSDVVTVEVLRVQRAASLSVTKELIVDRVNGLVDLLGIESDNAIRGKSIEETFTISDNIRRTILDRFANDSEVERIEAVVKASNGDSVTISAPSFRPRRRAPRTVRLTLREELVEGDNIAFTITDDEREGGDEFWDKLSLESRQQILDAVQIRLFGPVAPLSVQVDGIGYRILLNKQDVRFPFPPTSSNPFGLDNSGRDVFARILYALRISLNFGLLLVAITMVIGISIGGYQGYRGGLVDLVGQRSIEIWESLPFLYIMIMMGSLLGRSFLLLLVIYGLFNWIGISYYVRGEFLKLRKQPFVEAANCLGLSSAKIMWKHILPNSLVPVITFFPFSLVGAIFSLSALDFLGFGLPPPTPSWGELLSQAQEYKDAWWLVLYPSLALFIVILLGVFIGEGVRAAFDPRVNSRFES